jgi:hypothetical protein
MRSIGFCFSPQILGIPNRKTDEAAQIQQTEIVSGDHFFDRQEARLSVSPNARQQNLPARIGKVVFLCCSQKVHKPEKGCQNGFIRQSGNSPS